MNENSARSKPGRPRAVPRLRRLISRRILRSTRSTLPSPAAHPRRPLPRPRTIYSGGRQLPHHSGPPQVAPSPESPRTSTEGSRHDHAHTSAPPPPIGSPVRHRRARTGPRAAGVGCPPDPAGCAPDPAGACRTPDRRTRRDAPDRPGGSTPPGDVPSFAALGVPAPPGRRARPPGHRRAVPDPGRHAARHARRPRRARPRRTGSGRPSPSACPSSPASPAAPAARAGPRPGAGPDPRAGQPGARRRRAAGAAAG
jgi:hypothetical protein